MRPVVQLYADACGARLDRKGAYWYLYGAALARPR